LPPELLRWLAREAGARLWSSEPDLVVATRDLAMLVATAAGKRTLTLPKPLALVGREGARAAYEFDLEMGEVRVLVGGQK
jgi:hypothetical protein